MKKTLYDYKDKILKLPAKDKYTKEDLLIPELLVEEEGNIEIYYAPHNEYHNSRAKVFIIGITPGFQQMSTAIATAHKGLRDQLTIEEIQYRCKQAGRFSGSLRKNIISMLDEIQLSAYLNIEHAGQLFAERDELLHTVSLIPYSVFVKKQNYTGHTPKLTKSPFLMKYINENFLEEYHRLEDAEKVLLIPLGKAVEEVLVDLEEEGKIAKGQILLGFPHPSGANVNRVSQLEENKDSMTEFLRRWSGK